MMLPNTFQVMPVREKKPLISWKGLTEKIQSIEEKAAILEHGAAGTIGIVTGAVSNLFVLDIDGPQGEKSLEGKFIPKSWTVKTPHGRHVYFRWIPELENLTTTKAGILEGVDVRGTGGYVVWYGWETAPHLAALASPPSWLIELLPKKEGREIKPGVLSTLGSVRPGNRNQSFASLAGGLRARGYTVDEMYALLEPKAKEVELPLSELRGICTSIGRYAAPEAPKAEATGESVEAFLAEQEPVKWICKPFIAEQSIGFTAGLPETRKTFVLFDLAIECARGGMWLGKFPVTKQRVLVIDQERAKSETQRRFKALMADKGIRPTDLRGQLFIRAGTSTKIDDIRSFEALKREIAETRPGLIIVDSLATFHNREESNRMEIQQVLERIKQIRQEFGCSLMFVHHETKMAHQSRREGNEPSYLDMAGNVAIPAAAEVVLSVVKFDDQSSMVHHTKSTLGVKAASFMVKVEDTAEGNLRVSAF